MLVIMEMKLNGSLVANVSLYFAIRMEIVNGVGLKKL
jgi:hypothetical protein